MAHRKEQDEISKLLDSFQEEEALEEKMEGFAQRKKRTERKKMQREPEIPNFSSAVKPKQSDGDTVVLRADDGKSQSGPVQGGTVMFDPNTIEKEKQKTEKTVVINDNEIQSLLEEDQAPKLRREVVSKPRNTHGNARKQPSSMKKKSSSGPNTAVIVIVVIVCLLVVGGLGFGIYSLLNSGESEEERTARQEAAYNRIMDWLEGVEDDDYSDIVDYEDDYNMLSDSQKEEIDDWLTARTGYTFDELLAHERSADKQDSSNNNTQIAELRAQLQSLQAQLEDAEAALSDAQDTLSDAQDEYESLSEQLSTAQEAQTAYSQALTELQAWQNSADGARYQTLIQMPNADLSDSEMTELRALATTYNQLNSAVNSAYTTMTSAGNVQSLQSQVTSAQSAVSSAQSAVNAAQATVDDLNSQIRDIRQQIRDLE